MKDITRSSVNISSKDQEKFKVFHKETKETTDMKELAEVREILGGELEWRTKAMSKWERKSKQLKQIL